MHVHLDAVSPLLRDGEQFDRIPELASESDVLSGEVAYSLDVDIPEVYVPSGGQPDENGEFVCGVDPVHVEGRVGLRETDGLRLRQDVREFLPLVGHPAEDVIARSVDDPVDLVDPVGGP